MLFRNLIWILGLNSWEYKIPKYLNWYTEKRKISILNTVILKKYSNSSSPSPINNLYIEQESNDYKPLDNLLYIKVILYNLWSLLILSTQLIQPIHLILRSFNSDTILQEYINLSFLYILTPLHYVWAKIYFSTNHFDSFFIKSNWKCNNYCNKLSVISFIFSFLSILPYIFLQNHVEHYWSNGMIIFWPTFILFETIGRNIILINSGVFILIFYNHLKIIKNFTKDIDRGRTRLQFDKFTVLSDLIVELTKIKSSLKCSIERFQYLVSITTVFGGIALILFIHHKYTTRVIIMTNTELYTMIALIYYLFSQIIFIIIMYKYSTIREKIHKYINSFNFINRFIKRSEFKKITNKTQYDNKLILIEEESATTLDWIILDRIIKENWIDFTVLGISTRDGSLVKKLLTFSTLFYTLLRFF
jgi:hypothetical protein